MDFIEIGDRLAFKYKKQVIYLDEFLVVCVCSDGQGIVKDKDGMILYELPSAYREYSSENLANLFIYSYCNDKINLKSTGPKRFVEEGISNIIFSNYIDKIIKLFKVYLKEECVYDIKRFNNQQNAEKRVEKFKNDIKLLDETLVESAKIKEEYNNFQNYKNKEIKEIENLF